MPQISEEELAECLKMQARDQKKNLRKQAQKNILSRHAGEVEKEIERLGA